MDFSRREILALMALQSSVGAYYISPAAAASDDTEAGQFCPGPDVTLNADGYTITLLSEFCYRDLRGEYWKVPAGSNADGASIPQVFWSYIGGPFEGKFRDASIIHDFYCVTRTRSAESTHACFHEAMLARGVSRPKAWVMYRAVVRFGPRWQLRTPLGCFEDGVLNLDRCATNSAGRPELQPSPETSLENLETFINDLSAEGISDEAEDLRKKIRL